ncbi:MAG: CapA family protein [Clostridium sp.]|nr:CapA family protein [Prevotella sp.]MCM1428743.1 CapA family protein [Clostridium sp.]MCM1475118.1 CapA family protein [Muribaculaceae bacterium]
MNICKTIFATIAVVVAAVLSSCGGQNTVSAGESSDSISIPDSLISKRQASHADTISFALVGDIMMGTITPKAYLPADDGSHLFDDAKYVFEKVNIVAGNLEGTLFDGPASSKPLGPNSYAFRTPAKYITNLTDAGFDFLGVANNHASDFGDVGRTATHSNLRKAGIKYAGIRGVCELDTIMCRGLKIGFTQFGHSRNTLSIMDYGEVKRVVSDLRKNCDIVVVSFHGGAEGKSVPHVPHKDEIAFGERRGNVEKFAHTAVDAGADIVFGHGPHVPRAAEIYKEKIIFYSLGNFCTPFRMSLSGISGYAPIAEVQLDAKGNFLGGKIHSLIQHSGIGPRLDNSNAAAKFIRQMSMSDFPNSPLSISDDGILTKK